MALFILIATGIFLAQFYNPTPEVANASVRDIVTGVWAGRFIRGLHYWTAQAMYILAALHLLRVFFTGSYKRPREANWLIGVSMFALVIGALFTGTVLKWDQEGFEALGHNLEIARLLGGAGLWFNPNIAPQVPLLERLTVAHIAIILTIERCPPPWAAETADRARSTCPRRFSASATMRAECSSLDDSIHSHTRPPRHPDLSNWRAEGVVRWRQVGCQRTLRSFPVPNPCAAPMCGTSIWGQHEVRRTSGGE